jgi:hypothetical protein
LALNSPTSDGRSVGIVRLRTTGPGVCLIIKFHSVPVFEGSINFRKLSVAIIS